MCHLSNQAVFPFAMTIVHDERLHLFYFIAILFPAWVSNYTTSDVLDEITHPFPISIMQYGDEEVLSSHTS